MLSKLHQLKISFCAKLNTQFKATDTTSKETAKIFDKKGIYHDFVSLSSAFFYLKPTDYKACAHAWIAS